MLEDQDAKPAFVDLLTQEILQPFQFLYIGFSVVFALEAILTGTGPQAELKEEIPSGTPPIDDPPIPVDDSTRSIDTVVNVLGNPFPTLTAMANIVVADPRKNWKLGPVPIAVNVVTVITATPDCSAIGTRIVGFPHLPERDQLLHNITLVNPVYHVSHMHDSETPVTVGIEAVYFTAVFMYIASGIAARVRVHMRIGNDSKADAGLTIRP